jgi:ribonucleoside-diphosphate reductase alpha chain
MHEFERIMLEDSYVDKSKGEKAEDVYRRVSTVGADNEAHAKRLLSYFERDWFRTSTPITSNIGTDNGLPISCFVQEIPDDKTGIFDKYYEAMVLSAYGGGVGQYWGNVREAGAKIKTGKTAGVIPLIKITEAAATGISQGSVRRGATAVYIDVHHPEIMEIIDLRKVEGASIKRRAPELHHGIVCSDEFMEAVINGTDYPITSRKDGSVVGRLDAFEVFKKIVENRVSTGEPYIYFSGNVDRATKDVYKKAGMKIKTSQLCSEVMLPTAHNYTNVCCLASVNLAKYDAWKDNYQFVEDIMRLLDNVVSIFIEKASKIKGFEDAVRAATYERSVGLGVMGTHTYLQQKMIPFESAIAEGFQRQVFQFLREASDKASKVIASEKGACPLSIEHGNGDERNICKMAVAPTASISILCGMVSQGIDPILSNYYTHENKTGKHLVKNQTLDNYFRTFAESNNKDKKWVDAQWAAVSKAKGSVQVLDWMPQDVKDVFKTAFEIDQKWVIHHAAARQEDIDQGQSVNIFLPADVDKTYLVYIHLLAYKLGLKSLYYCRSTSKIKASTAIDREVIEELKYEECLSCQ